MSSPQNDIYYETKHEQARKWFMKGVFAAYWNQPTRQVGYLWPQSVSAFDRINSKELEELADSWFEREMTMEDKDE